MFPRKIKTLEFSGKKIEVHDLTVAEVENILQRLNNTEESKLSSINFLFKDLDEYIIKLTTGLSEEEIKQMPEHVLAKVREAIRELNPFFSKAVDELLETARKLQEKTLQNS